jgi:alkanesulfonate monooxygenase SsuD/methylene tetrahydromethanopterin reductase-like flavin-dependent oxidoreductase (luciferase family)
MADFGLQGIPSDAPGDDRLSKYRNVLETLPPEFTTVWIEDHLQKRERPQLEGWTLLTYLAALYPRLKFGHLVISQSFRNPALLAKMAATLQHLTGGRYILGIGAGWKEDEYRGYGYDYPRGGVRVEQLAEAIEVIRAMWSDSPATYHGIHYRIEEAWCEPRPDPPPPIMVGTNGPKALGVAARLADWWNWDASWELVYRKPYEILHSHCEEIGRPIEDITLTAGMYVWLPQDQSEFEATFEHPFYPGQTFDVIGPTTDDAIREIRKLIAVGVAHFQPAFEDMATMQRFVDEVLPALA